MSDEIWFWDDSPMVAGSPVETGDAVVIDASGHVHASPRRHDFGRHGTVCLVCMASKYGNHGPCPGPREDE